MNRRLPLGPRPGFTLLEALALVALVSIVLPVVMYGIALSANAAGFVTQRDAAGRLAYNKLNEMILTGQYLSGDIAGDEPDPPLTYHWAFHAEAWTGQSNQEITASQTQQTLQTNQSNLQQLQMEVTWTSRNQPHSVVLTTLYYGGPQQ